jgi:hypothetical protein
LFICILYHVDSFRHQSRFNDFLRYAHFIIMILQLNFFFARTALWIPTNHWLCYYRSFVLGTLVILSAQIYKKPDLTGFPLLLNLTLALEGLAVLRFADPLLITANGNTTAAILMTLSNVVLWAATMRDVANLWTSNVPKSAIDKQPILLSSAYFSKAGKVL